jgi:hypothetical protein
MQPTMTPGAGFGQQGQPRHLRSSETVMRSYGIGDVFVGGIVFTSAAALLLLIVGGFRAWAALAAGLGLTLAFLLLLHVRGYRIAVRIDYRTFSVLAVIALGVVFRLQPYSWIAGGQDQGTYVNMSKYFQSSGSIAPKDGIRESLPAELRASYDSTNYQPAGPERYLEDRREGLYLPAVYVTDRDTSALAFQFYPLFPLWMSIFGELIGDDNRTYALVFFSLLSLGVFYLLALGLSGSQLTACIAGILLALNPLHAFFSKFPVTEVVALSFSALSFYYLLRYERGARQGDRDPALLFLSAGSIGCLFFTRISGFMYVPWFYLLLLLVELFVENGESRRQLRTYVVSVLLLYGLSVLFGLSLSFPYSMDIYQKSFSRALGEEWVARLVIIGLAMVLVYPAVLFARGRVQWRTGLRGVSAWRRFLPHLFLLLTIPGIYRVLKEGFADSREGLWSAAGDGAGAFLHWSPFVLFEYLSPFLLVLFCLVLWRTREKLDAASTLLLLFVLMFYGYLSFLQWFIPYQYYYARYVLSEALPYTLLFSVALIPRLQVKRAVAYTFAALSGVYMLLFSLAQFRGEDLEGYRPSLDRIKDYVEPGEPLIVGQRWLYSVMNTEIKTTLVFHYGFKVISTGPDNVASFIDHFCGQPLEYVHYLSNGPQPGLGSPEARLPVEARIFERKNVIPTELVGETRTHLLYRISCPAWKRSRGGG